MTEETKEQLEVKEENASTESLPEASGAKVGKGPLTLEQGRGGILGVKAGMTQIFGENGEALAVTVIDLRENRVTQVKSNESDGYEAVQVGFLAKKDSKMNRAEKGHAKRSGGQGFYHHQEIRLPEGADTSALAPGAVLNAGFLKEGDLVDLCSVSKGKGFQGVMKRHHFAGGPASHGASIVHRMPGSIGQRTDPGKVFKGKKMAGHMGHKRVTVQNVKVVRVDLENKILLVNGSVPGPKSGVVTIQKAAKKWSSKAAG